MQTMLSIKIDKDLKQEAQKLAQTLGVSLNAVINQNIKEFIGARTVTFSSHPMPNKKTAALLRELSLDAKKGKNMVGPFSSAKEMVRSLNS